MRVTFLLPYASLSGGIRVVRIYAEQLAQRGHDVRVVSTRYRFPSRREQLAAGVRHLWWRLRGVEEPSHMNGIGVSHTRLPHAGPITATDVPDGDVIIATWWETAEWLAAMPRSKGAPVYFLQGYEAHGHQPGDRVQATWRLPFQKIAVAQWLVDLARDAFADDSAKLVPNAVDAERFDAPPRSKQRIPTVGLIYDDNPIKGCAAALEAVRCAQAVCPDLRLVCFGVGPVFDELPLPRGAEYTTRPRQDALRDLYGACDAWIFASRQEGFGLPILEAMACRTPVIATRAGAAPELVKQGGGVLVDGFDGADIAEAIVELVGMDEPQWRALSDAAYRTAHAYTWDDATDLFEQAIVGWATAGEAHTKGGESSGSAHASTAVSR